MRARPEEMACVRDACRRVIHHTAVSVSKQENHGAFLHTAEAGGSLRNIIVGKEEAFGRRCLCS